MPDSITQTETDIGVAQPAVTEGEPTAVEEQPVQEVEPVTGNVLRRHIKEDPKKKLLAKHRIWMDSLQHEYPMPHRPFRIGVYIRFYNQTKYENYLEKHIQQFTDDIALCKKWTLVDFYIDRGMTAPKMENAKEWCRLLGDCFSGNVDLIVTQKVSNVSSDADEISFIARILAAQKHPVGIYFISEDIFTLASYYRYDLTDRGMLPYGYTCLPDDELDGPLLYDGQSVKEIGAGDETENSSDVPEDPTDMASLASNCADGEDHLEEGESAESEATSADET